MRHRLPTLVAASAALALGAASMAHAQADAAAAPAEPAAEAATAISDDQVNSFALAMNAVSTLNQEYAAKIQAAPDDAARTQIQQEAATEMTAAVEKAGISPTEYNQIAQAAQADEDLRARIGAAMQANGISPAS
ncbi:DUF4168 domain-containing protein [Phenylobacterium sp.]|uniref:DUF4168 domain-containing protein n=1 Tax=Phenylobacterium sp. TaxID=1871053 RepID=UPI0027310EEA|nr:DUF4168 domain-containing protein [Phenylobacterium sp.]MDP2215616.1 DUF4168 domain-containing protein [Phenylobacterium sp.]